LRRKPTALTRTIAGAALAASAAVVIPVWAQQNPPTAESGRDQPPTSPVPAPAQPPAAAPSASTPSPAAIPDARAAAAAQANTVYGIGVSRGARYLVRNGLDYIEYQEYERALKYLREAEARQAELTAAEKLVLKQGIENAQRGLREAVGAKTPYAASKRRSRAGGFTVAQRPKEARGRTLATEAAVAAASRNVGIDADIPPDPKGDPIQLTSGSSADDDGANVIRADASVRKAPAMAKADTAAKVTAAAAAALTQAADVADVPDPAPLPDLDQLATSAPAPPPAQLPAPAKAPSVLPKAEDANPTDVAKAKTAEADFASPLPAFDPSVLPTAQPKPDVTPAPAATPVPIQLETIGERPPAAESAPAPVVEPLPAFDQPIPANAGPQPAAEVDAEAKADAEATPAAGTNADDELPPLPPDISLSAGSAAPLPTAVEPPAAEAAPVPVSAINPTPAPIVEEHPAPMPISEPAPEVDRLPPLPAEAEAVPVPPADVAGEQKAVPAPETPTRPEAPAVVESAAPAADPTAELASPAPVPADLSVASPSPVSANPAEPSAAETVPVSGAGSVGSGLEIPQRANPISRLSDDMRREVEQIARQQDEVVRRRQIQGNSPAPGSAPDAGASPFRDGPNNYGTQSQVDISRAPSPAQARPIHAIPVPEDYVPLAPRDWSPQRKYWSAAGTCHMPLYFQDAALERYGHNVEQFFGPAARFLTWPLDDPTQSTQRNQILQPVFSIGLFAFQIAALPYNLIVDPPWEAEYDLGYYRPGDRVPTDIYYLPLHGVGPPLKGKNY
jgi:hypothetical protein